MNRKQRKPKKIVNEDNADDSFWSENINIDELLGDPIVFDYHPQVASIVPVNWRFMKLCVKNTCPNSDHLHQKQTPTKSTVSWKFKKQLPLTGSDVNWNFLKATDDHPKDYWTFLKQIDEESKIIWLFKCHGSEVSKVNWQFVGQVNDITPLDWYFEKLSIQHSSVNWNFVEQVPAQSTVCWDFSPVTPTKNTSNWKFHRQTKDLSSVPWKFIQNFRNLAPIHWGFQSTLKNQKSISWKFVSHSNQKSAINWNFQPSLTKEIHTAKLGWAFKKNLTEKPRAVPVVESQIMSIKPIRWNLGRMTKEDVNPTSYDAIMKENQLFRDHYDAAYAKARKTGPPSTLIADRERREKKRKAV